MATITASTLTTLLNTGTDLAAATAEEIIDLAVDMLNLFGKDLGLPNMTGTAGTKTLSVDSREKGAIMIAARAIFYGFYQGVNAVNVGNMAVVLNDVMGNATVIGTIRLAAEELKESDITIG